MKMQTPATSADTAPDPADIAIAQAKARQRRRRCWLVGLVVVAVFVGYPLSPGPVMVIGQSGCVPPFVLPLLDVCMDPLDWADDHSDIVRDFYDWYLPFFDSSR